MAKPKLSETHPFVFFWLGILTGAVVAGLVFFYSLLNADDYQSSIFRFFRLTQPTYQIQNTGTGSLIEQQVDGMGGSGTFGH